MRLLGQPNHRRTNGKAPLNGHNGFVSLDRLREMHRGLLDEGDFNAQIRCERLRADRENRVFAVALFLAPAGADAEGLVAKLTERAFACCRESDTKGVVRQSGRPGVGVVLPSCTRNQAGRLVRELREAYVEAARKRRDPGDLHVEVWQYPSSTPLFQSRNGDAGDEIVASPEDVDAQRMLDHALPPPMPPWKRFLDIVGAGTALTLFSPVMLAAAAAIRLTSPGPVFFRQTRAGYLGRPFELLKFRTMHTNVDPSRHREQMRSLIREGRSIVPGETPDAMVKLEDRDQIIPVVGRFLRASCIDELPQLINTLRGEMSLVGPRPPIPYEAAEYTPWHLERFDAVPGMTGLWQVSGKNRLSFQEMVRLDIRYGRRRSIWLDLWILATTPMVVAGLFIESTSSERK